MEKSKVIQIILSVLMTFLCVGIMIICLIRPSEILHTYMNTAFNDESMIISDSSMTDVTAAESEKISENTVSDAIGEFAENDITEETVTSFEGEISEKGSVIIPDSGSKFAVLECKSADIYVPVYWGGGSELLEKGACQNPASAAVGASGNSVISAHFNTFFANLPKIQPGDIVTVYTEYGRFTYKASEIIKFNETDSSYIENTEDNRLTLYTCKAELLGVSSERVGVVCTQESCEFYNVKTGE